jgi:hypothetical protein
MKTFLVVWLMVRPVMAGGLEEIHRMQMDGRREAIEKQFPGPMDAARRAKLLAEFQPVSTGGDFVVATNRAGEAETVRGRVDHGVSEIGIERKRCFGICPEYTFIVSSDGTCRYLGGHLAKIQGNKTGRISLSQFHEVAQLMREIGYFQLRDDYETGLTCQATVYTSAVANGRRKTIRNYGDGGPRRLWAVEQFIDRLLEAVRWDG